MDCLPRIASRRLRKVSKVARIVDGCWLRGRPFMTPEEHLLFHQS